MTSQTATPNRREQILQALAHMLQHQAGQRITTKSLAAEVGVSEAALYRHFPSKARMFEGLIDFIEETLLSRINLILKEEKATLTRCELILQLLRETGIPQRVVAEPRADNAKMINYLQRAGFYREKEFDFPHKRAALMILGRERFFDRCKLA